MRLPKFNTIITHIHSVDEKNKIIYVSFASNESTVSASAKQPCPINLGDMPKDKEVAKRWLQYFGVGVLMREEGHDAVNQGDIDYWKGLCGNSFTNTHTPISLMEEFGEDFTSGHQAQMERLVPLLRDLGVLQ